MLESNLQKRRPSARFQLFQGSGASANTSTAAQSPAPQAAVVPELAVALSTSPPCTLHSSLPGSLLLLKHARHVPTPGPLHLLFLLPEQPSP